MKSNTWSLEVIRGQDTGRTYVLAPGETVLGNALNGSPGLDLGRHEGEGPRKMAPRQASLRRSEQGLALQDLDSPGGTFVNRQRLLPGQSRTLQVGDVIQLGGVQLKVVEPSPAATPKATPPSAVPPAPKPSPPPPPIPPATPAPTASKSPTLPAPFVLASGATCRTWDDFLTVSAQRWTSLRDELSSGRLAAYFVSIQKPAFAPSPNGTGTPDERLDAWLATLPMSRPGQPELDVHPATIVVRAVPGGGSTRVSFKVTNTGYRLLRSTVRVDQGCASWIRIISGSQGSEFTTVDQSDITLELTIPEGSSLPRPGFLTVDSNGGTKRVEVRLERPSAGGFPSVDEDATAGSLDLLDFLSGQSFARRVAIFALVALGLRTVVVIGGMASGVLATKGDASPSGGMTPPSQFFAIAALFSMGFAVLMTRVANRSSTSKELFSPWFAAVSVGLFVTALVTSLRQLLESRLGLGDGLFLGTLLPVVLWGALGAVLGVASTKLIPTRTNGTEVGR